MPAIIAISQNFDKRDQCIESLTKRFPGNLSVAETRVGEACGLYWILPENYNAVERSEIRERLIQLRQSFQQFKIDFIYLNQFLDSKSPNLFVFDMDSTLIREEVIDELARRNGLYEEVASVTKIAMEGNMSFDESLRMRVAYLKDLPKSVFDDVYDHLNPNDGVPEFLDQIKTYKHSYVAVLSGGFVPILEKFANKYNLDYYEANVLDESNGRLTGTVNGRIVNRERKRDAFLELLEKYQVEKKNSVAVGDGANDALMLAEAEFGIGFHAKPKLKDELINWVDYNSMESLLLLFGPSL
ncbi:phosphoserine phosphatase SerB [Leptospira sp. GIMC2001]|uniref:phosphoserine phosphatase SerB n=1 Tax=Leptospira sp. GIMC2001 TaxID=1513297 RepID=UPI00234A1E7A|nr:phosphoserine phosphatase SerB [Leptospira sp. GIMC2001]WCL50377.1 phosphoserine phosphatase SerB [Leptospira sp. GIMC2001]